MADKKKPAGPKTPDQVIRDVRALIERRGWVPTGSSVSAEGEIVVTARPKQEGE